MLSLVDVIIRTSSLSNQQDSSGKPIIPEVIDNQDGTFKIIYTPKDVDRYTIKVKYGGVQVPKSPWVISTSPTGDASKCDIIGEFGLVVS